jgi:hypothetical protein
LKREHQDYGDNFLFDDLFFKLNGTQYHRDTWIIAFVDWSGRWPETARLDFRGLAWLICQNHVDRPDAGEYDAKRADSSYRGGNNASHGIL